MLSDNPVRSKDLLAVIQRDQEFPSDITEDEKKYLIDQSLVEKSPNTAAYDIEDGHEQAYEELPKSDITRLTPKGEEVLRRLMSGEAGEVRVVTTHVFSDEDFPEVTGKAE